MQKLLEVGIIVSAFVAIFITLSLFTFSPVDPSWSQQQWVAEIQNSGGRVGAWIADILFFGFGFLAYLIPVIIVSFAWAILWKPTFNFDVDFLNLSLRIVGFIFTFFSLSALIALNVNDYLYYPSGGLVGDILAQSMLGFFSLLAVNLILLTFLISGTTLLFGFSWIRLIDGIGEHTLNAIEWLGNLPETIKKMKQQRSEGDQERLAEKYQLQQQKLEKKQQKQAIKEQKKLATLSEQNTAEDEVDNIDFSGVQDDIEQDNDLFMGTSFVNENEQQADLSIDNIDRMMIVSQEKIL